jgi:acetyl esterase/lipase
MLVMMAPTVEPDVVYAKVGDVELKMDLYLPAASAPKTNSAVVLIHGGAWISGTRKDMGALANYMATRGLFAASVQYRLAPKHKWPAMLDDVQTSVRFLRANAAKYGYDPKRIGAAGASAGGHLAIFLGARETRDAKPEHFPDLSSRVAAVFDIFGPTDMSRDYPATVDFLFEQVLGKKRIDASAEIRDASPLLFVKQDAAPMFIFQGLDDPLVNPNQSRYLEAKYKELSLPVEAVYIEGVGHALPVDTNDKVKKGVERGVDWLIKHLTK